jgi:subtilisin family serine protease
LDTALPVNPQFHNAADDTQGAHQYMAARMGYELVHNTMDYQNELIRGYGVTAAVVDFNLDPFHPALFHADGGHFDWVDMDGSGSFTPGEDGVDLDGNGTVDDSEILQLAEFPVVVLQWGGAEHNGDGTFDPYMDYLFMDLNDNGKRDVGSEVNATSETPGLGEPVFVGDDANGNGELDPGERVLLLGTSKIKAIYDVANDAVYTPGPGFEEYRQSISGGREGEDIEFHGTYECTRVAGGHAEIQHMGGLAPAADLIFIDIETQSSNPLNAKGDIVTAMSWASEIGADAFNFAFGETVSKHADGSSPLEDVMATMHAEGVVQSASAGNDGTSDGHGIVQVPAASTISVPVRVGAHKMSPNRFYVTLRWRGPDRINLTSVLGPDETLVNGLPSAPVMVDGKPLEIIEFGSESSRGTHLKARIFYTAQGEFLPKGTWNVQIQNTGSSPISVDFWTRSEYSFSLVGIDDSQWITGNQTVSYPATADGIFSVGACSVFHFDPGNHLGPDYCPFAWYSSRGPRIDGPLQVNIVSPTDLLSGYPLLKYSGGYVSFGGTSGASPHVTGTAALAIQANRRAKLSSVSGLISDALDKPTELGELPNHYWGDGILNTWETVHPGRGRDGSSEDVGLKIQHPETVEASTSFSVHLSLVNENGDAVPTGAHYQIDAGYDGSFESYREGTGHLRVWAPAEPGTLELRVRAIDDHGAIWGGVAKLSVVEPIVVPPDNDEVVDVTFSDDQGDGNVDGATSGNSSGGCHQSAATTSYTGLILMLGMLLLLRRRDAFFKR